METFCTKYGKRDLDEPLGWTVRDILPFLDEGLNAYDYAVMVKVMVANSFGEEMLTTESLAREVNLGKNTVSKSSKKLKEQGYLTQKYEKGFDGKATGKRIWEAHPGAKIAKMFSNSIPSMPRREIGESLAKLLKAGNKTPDDDGHPTTCDEVCDFVSKEVLTQFVKSDVSPGGDGHPTCWDDLTNKPSLQLSQPCRVSEGVFPVQENTLGKVMDMYDNKSYGKDNGNFNPRKFLNRYNGCLFVSKLSDGELTKLATLYDSVQRDKTYYMDQHEICKRRIDMIASQIPEATFDMWVSSISWQLSIRGSQKYASMYLVDYAEELEGKLTEMVEAGKRCKSRKRVVRKVNSLTKPNCYIAV